MSGRTRDPAPPSVYDGDKKAMAASAALRPGGKLVTGTTHFFLVLLLLLLLLLCLQLGLAAGTPRQSVSLADQRAVEHWFALYADVVDHRKFEEYASLFAGDAVVDYSASGGSSGTVPEMQSFLETSFTFLASQHLVSNVIVAAVQEQEGTFKAQAMFHNPMVLRAFGDIYSPFFVCGGWYASDFCTARHESRCRPIDCGVFWSRRYHVTLQLADDESGRLVCTGLSQEMLYNTVVRECVILLGLFGGVGYFIRSKLCISKSKHA